MSHNTSLRGSVGYSHACISVCMHLPIWCNELIEVHVVMHVSNNSEPVFIAMYSRECYMI